MAEENRETLLAIGALQGALSGIRDQIEAMGRDQRVWQQAHTADDKAAFVRLEVILERSSGVLKKDADTEIQALKSDLLYHADKLEDLKARQDVEAGRAEQNSKHAALFRWIISSIIAALALVFGQHLYVTGH